jgi:drug/metabolite transporter (DMT)-like permease
MVNAAVALFGLAGVLGALAEIPSPLVVLGRVVFGGLALLGVARLLRLRLRVRQTDLLLLIVQGVLLAVHWAAFFQSIAVAGVAIGLISFATFPLFTAALEPLLLGTKLSRLQLVAALCILAGVWVLVPELSLGSTSTQGVLWGLTGAATFALLTVFNRRLGRTYPGLLLSLYQNGIAAVLLLPVLLVVSPAPLLEPRVFVILLVLGVGCTAVAHTLFIAGLRQMTAQLASLLACLEPVWGIALGVLLLGEQPAPRALLGGAIVVGATLVPVLFASRASARHNGETAR